MNNTRLNFARQLTLTACAALAAVALTACGNGDGADSASQNQLLAFVPANTPYLAGNLAPVPGDVVDAMFRRGEPILEAVQATLADTRIKLSGKAAEENPELALMGALMAELDGKLNRQGLESLGFTTESHQVLYGMGIFPVVRLSLGDAEALRATIARIEASSGMDFPNLALAGQPYWKLTPGGEPDHGDAPVSMYFAIIESAEPAHLALGILPHDLEAELLPAFLGQILPDDSTAQAQLADLNRRYGYSSFGSGVVDFQRLFQQFTSSGSLLNRALLDHGVDMDSRLNPACEAEIATLIERAPRMVMGTTQMTVDAMGAEYRVELANDLASDLVDLVADVPGIPAQTDRLLELAFGIRIGAARDFLIRKATEWSQKSFECEPLREIPRQASEALVKLNYPMPPLVNNFRGIRASLSELPETGNDMASVTGTVALHVAQPEMFVNMAAMFLPQMAEMNLVKGADPVRVPESLATMPGTVAHAAMSDGAIGIAMGPGEETRLLDFLEAEPANDGRFLSMEYDTATYLERMDAMTSALSDDHYRDPDDPAWQQRKAIAKAVEESVRNWAGRSRMSLKFDRHGFAIDSHMEFKD